MKTNNLFLINSFVLIVVISLIGAVVNFSHASTCIQINSDLSSGQTDKVSGGPIKMLQTYLQLNGFFASSPNGHFGAATLSAVKAFQSHVGISNTGYVGPLTRAYISQNTCNTGSVSNTVITPVIAPTQTPVSVVSNTNVTSPATGQVLSIGSSTVIRWNNPINGNYNIVLEQPGGAGAGFVAMSQSLNINSNQYVWKVGQVFSSQSNSNTNVAPGTYRVRIEGANSGASSNDQTSGWFTILAQQFGVSSVVPSSAYADNTTSIVLFGTGFTTGSTVYFDTNYSNLRANNTYVSPDGTVMVFTIPTTVGSGPHTLYINNGQNSNPVTLPFTVNSIN